MTSALYLAFIDSLVFSKPLFFVPSKNTLAGVVTLVKLPVVLFSVWGLPVSLLILNMVSPGTPANLNSPSSAVGALS